MASIRNGIGEDMEDRYLSKAKRLDNEEWVQGYLVYDNRDKLYRIIMEIQYSTGTCITTDNAPRVDSSTICRCTGSKDKNGKLIWGNDIVKTSGHIFVCYWDEYNFEWGLKSKTHTFGLGYIDKWLIEVIGNIFDNQELLGSEE